MLSSSPSRSVSRAVKRTGRTVVRAAKRKLKQAGRFAKKAYRGTVPKFVRRGISKYGATALQATGTGLSFVPGIGSGAAAGLAGAAALAQGKSWQQAAKEAAMGALPGGALTRAALEAGVGVASGKRVDRALLAGARRSIPGGAAGQAVFDASLAVARGKRPDRAIKRAAWRAASAQVPPHLRRGAAAAIAAAQGQRVDRAMIGAARQIAQQQTRGLSQDRIFSAVGGQALAAQAAANRAAAVADQAQRARRRIAAGRGKASDRAAVARAAEIARGYRRAAGSRSPFARIALGALRSQPGTYRGRPRWR
jgi:hypothetical protein